MRKGSRHAVEFINALTHTKGAFAGQPFRLRPWQRRIVEALFKTKAGRRVIRTCLLMLPRKNGKALALDTELPTPIGYRPLAEIQAGDEVFGPDGRPTRVIFATEPMLDHVCYRVTFSDGASVVADAEHRWTVFDIFRERLVTLTTTEIAETVRVGHRPGYRQHRYRIRVARPLQYEQREYLIEPYALGAWLGDGNTQNSSFTTADVEVLEALAAVGVSAHVIPSSVSLLNQSRSYTLGRAPARNTRRSETFHAKLRTIGVLGDKHIPADYLTGSVDQRWALLQGLMDTDGSVCYSGLRRMPRCEFGTTSEALALGAMTLIASLGLKPTLKVTRARLYGLDCGPAYRITFTAYADQPVFQLPRKQSRLARRPDRPARSTNRSIISVELTASVPVRCLKVERDDGMFLVGRECIATHNTEIAAAIALYMLLADGEVGAEVYSAAADRDQAALVFGVAAQMIRNNKTLNARCEILDSQKRIVHHPSGSVYRAISAEAYSKHGFNPSAVIYDELHAAPDRRLWDVLATAQGARSDPVLFAISTAGYDRHSILWELYSHAKKVAENPALDPTFLPIIYEAPTDADWLDEQVWRAANPALGDFRSLDEMRIMAARAREIPAQENSFRRLYLNQWCAVAGTLVLMADGSRRAIETLAIGDRVQGFDELTGTLRHATISEAGPNGIQTVYRLTTARGRMLTVTGNHRCWTRRGWVQADALAPGDHVYVAHCWRTSRGAKRLGPDLAYLLGLMVGDGSCGKPQTRWAIRLTTTRTEVAAGANEIMAQFGCGFHALPDGVHWPVRHLTPSGNKSTWLKRFLKRQGLYGKVARTKRVPSSVFKSGPGGWAGFMSGYLDSDGCVARDRVVWVSSSNNLLSDCQDLLAGLGVQSALTCNSPTARGRLEVRHGRSLQRLAMMLAPRHDLRALKLSAFRALGPSDPDEAIWWDRVVDASYVGEAATFGVAVEGCHTHVTNGLVTHNTESETRWLSMEAWDACRGEVEMPAGTNCLAGLDLASTQDVAAAVLLFDRPDGRLAVLPRFWVPAERIGQRALRDRVPYDLWARQGALTATEGNVIDYARIRADLGALAKRYHIREIGFDPWNAEGIRQQLEADGLRTVKIPQTVAFLNEPTKRLGDLVAQHRLVHDGHPVLRWMAGNLVVTQDANGNIRPDKAKSGEKIDGMVALILALAVHLRPQAPAEPAYQMYIYGAAR